MATSNHSAPPLITQLQQGFVQQVERALNFAPDGSDSSLAVVDHYLSLVHDEERSSIVELVAAGAGAYFGELVCRELGGFWLGSGEDPRQFRLLLRPQLLYFSPIDLSLNAATYLNPQRNQSFEPELDVAFHLNRKAENGKESVHEWVEQRLGELPPLPEDQIHSLTARYETLKLILEMLAQKQSHEGKSPREYTVNDYLSVLQAAQ